MENFRELSRDFTFLKLPTTGARRHCSEQVCLMCSVSITFLKIMYNILLYRTTPQVMDISPEGYFLLIQYGPWEWRGVYTAEAIQISVIVYNILYIFSCLWTWLWLKLCFGRGPEICPYHGKSWSWTFERKWEYVMWNPTNWRITVYWDHVGKGRLICKLGICLKCIIIYTFGAYHWNLCDNRVHGRQAHLS